MSRNFQGTTLSCVLVVLIAMKHAALGFCLCEREFFLGSSHCNEGAGADRCACEHDAPQPCDDCEIPIVVEVEDFVWSGEFVPPKAPAAVDMELSFAPAFADPRGMAAIRAAAPIRGSPPGFPPAFLLASVLRL